MGNIKWLLFLFLVSFSYSQGVVGKMYSKQEADYLYGPVIIAVQVQTSFLNKYLINQDSYIMFRIYNNNLVVADSHRKPLYPENASVNPDDIFRYFSNSMVLKTLSAGNDMITRIELRNNTIITITNGNSTLEMGGICPPVCM